MASYDWRDAVVVVKVMDVVAPALGVSKDRDEDHPVRDDN